MGWSWNRKDEDDKRWWDRALRWAYIMASPAICIALYKIATIPGGIIVAGLVAAIAGACVATLIVIGYLVERFG